MIDTRSKSTNEQTNLQWRLREGPGRLVGFVVTGELDFLS